MTARHTYVGNGKMEFNCHLVLKSDGSMRLARGQTALGASERALALQLTVPQSIFKTPSLRATIEVEGGTDRNGVITAEKVTAAQDAIAGALGVDVVVTVKEPE
jgi:hypothetical protein